jgi:hypothetical protein
VSFGPAAPGPLPITIDGRPYQLNVPGGRALCGIATDGQWPQLVPGLLAADDRAEIEARLRDPRDRLSLYACWRIAVGVAPELYGVEWWAAQRLCALAVERWRDWSAWCVAHGLDVDTASAHRIVSSVWAWVCDSVHEEKDLQRAQSQLFDPPPELRRTGTARPAGFSEAELAAQAQQLAVMAADEEEV